VTNVLIFMVAIIICCGGLFAIADGLLNEQRRRASLRYAPIERSDAWAHEIQEWLRHQ
jgi:hypothetical protein